MSDRYARILIRLGIVAVVIFALVVAYNTRYGAGHADGVRDLACVENAPAAGQPTSTCFPSQRP